MSNNETSIIISAVDKTGDALRSVKSGLGQVGDQATSLQGTLAGFAAAAGVMTFAGMIKGSIDAAAGLHDMAQATGASVEALSALKDVAALSDTSLESVGNAMAKMAKVMPDMSDKSSAASKALAQIGLEGDKIAKMKTDDAFRAIAKGMAGVNDSAGKTAVSMTLFGKSGKELIAFLNDLGVAGDLQAKITKEQAAASDEFGDNLMKLTISGQAWKRELAMGMVPALSDFSTAMVDVLNGSGGLRDEMHKLSADGSINEWATSTINAVTHVADAFDGFGRVFTQFASSLASSINAIHTYSEISKIWVSGKVILPSGREEIKQLLADREGLFNAYMEDTNARLGAPLIGQKLREAFQTTQEARKKALADYAESVKVVTAAYAGYGPKVQQAALAALEKARYGGKGDVDVTKLAADPAKAKSDGYDALIEKIKQYDTQIQQEMSTQKALTQGDKLAIEVKQKLAGAHLTTAESAVKKLLVDEKALALSKEIEKHDLAAMNRLADATNADQAKAQGIIDATTSLREQSAELGLTAEALVLIKQSRVDDQIGLESWRLSLLGGTEAEGTQADAIRETIAALQDRKVAMKENDTAQKAADAIKAQGDAWKSIEDTAHQTFVSIFDSGKSAFDRLKDTLKNGLLDLLYQMTVKKWIFNIAASVSGTASAESAFGTTAGASSLGGLGNLVSTGNSLYSAATGQNTIVNSALDYLGLSAGTGATGIAASSAAYVGVSDAVATGVAAGMEGAIGSGLTLSAGTGIGSAAAATTGMGAIGATGAGVAVAEGGGVAAAGTAGLAAVPVAGWIALAAIAAYSIFKKDGGGPKTEGDYFGTVAAGGSVTTQANTDWYTGHSADAQMAAMAPALAKSVYEVVKTLGGDATGVGIGYGFNTDPKGTAPDNVGAGVTDAAGNYVYRAQYDIAREGASAAIQLEMQRITLAAVKASEGIKPIFKELISGIDLTTASAETMAQAISDMQSIVTLRATFDTLNLGADNLSMSLISSAGGIATLTTELSSYYDNYFTTAEKTAKTTDALTKAFADAGVAMPASKDALRAAVEEAAKAGAAGEATFSTLMALAPAFAAVADAAAAAAKTASDAAAEVLAKLTESRASLAASFASPTTLAQATASVQASGLIDITGMDAEAMRAAMRAVISTATQSTLDTISGLLPAFEQVIQGITDAADLAAEHAANVLAERQGLQDQIDALVMTTAESRAKEISVLDASNRALQSRIWALNDEAAAVAAAAEAAKAARAAYDSNVGTISAASLSLADAAYSTLERAVSSQKSTITAAYDAQKSAWAESVKSATEIKTTLTSLSASLASAVKTVVVESDALSLSRRAAAQMTLNSALVASQSGQSLTPFADAIAGAIGDLSKPSESLYATFDDYARAQGRANAVLTELSKNSDSQKSVAELMLDATNAAAALAETQYNAEIKALDQTLIDAQEQINVLKGIDTSVISIATAMTELAAAIRAAQLIKATVTPTATATTANIVDDYASSLGRAPDTAGLAYWQDRAAAGATAAQIASEIANAPEVKINAMYETILGRHSDAAGLAYWQGRVDAGSTLEQIAAEITNSQEYKAIHGYASGGFHAGGLRLVGENGPELEVTGPSRIFSAAQTKNMLSGSGNTARLEALIEALTEQVAALKASSERTAANTGAQESFFRRISPDGESIKVAVAA